MLMWDGTSPSWVTGSWKRALLAVWRAVELGLLRCWRILAR